MQIIFSPAKEMNLENPIQKQWQVHPLTLKITDYLMALDEENLQNILNINSRQLMINKSYLSDFNKPQTYKAVDLYHGLAYRSLKSVNLTAEDMAYLNRCCFILSALYGPIRPKALIKAYRLDFTMPIKLEEKSLKSLWKPIYNQTISQGDLVVNLASQEFSSLFDKDQYEWLDIDFIELVDGKEKRHSTLSKKARGLMLAYLAKVKAKDIKDIGSFNLDGYKLDPNRSDDHKLTFIKELDK